MRDECNKEYARLGHGHPEDFFICFWQKNPSISLTWVIYRGVLVFYLFIASIVVIILRDLEDSPWYKNPIFLYNWAFGVEFLTFILAFAFGVRRYKLQKKGLQLHKMETMPWYLKFFWVTYTISATCTTLVSLVFCIFIYSKGVVFSYMNYSIVTHVSFSVAIIIDFSFAAIPFRLLHLYFPVLFVISYGIFSLIYQKSGGTGNQGKIPIYKILDWRDPLRALGTCAVHLVILVIIHCGFYALYLLKLYLKRRIHARQENVNV